MHYYQKNIADYRKDTSHLTLVEHGIYNQIIDTYYLDEKPIKTQSVMRRLAIDNPAETQALNNVLNDFFQHDKESDSWSHKRIMAEIDGYHSKAEVARRNGKLGGRPKKTTSVILANPDLTQQKPNAKLTINHKPLTINQEPTISAKASYPFQDEFKKRINKIYSRRETTKWSAKEIKAFKALKIVEEDMKLIEAYCHPTQGSEYRRRDIQTLLNNWNGEVDRAKAFKPRSTDTWGSDSEDLAC